MNRAAITACLIDLALWLLIAAAFLICWGIVP
jgi:hypothetical protein